MKKKEKVELRYYDIPQKEGVLALLGENWVRSYGDGIDYLHFHNLLEIGVCRSGTGELVLDSRIVPDGIHSEITWQKSVPFFIPSWIFPSSTSSPFSHFPSLSLNSPILDSKSPTPTSPVLFFRQNEKLPFCKEWQLITYFTPVPILQPERRRLSVPPRIPHRWAQRTRLRRQHP